MDKSFWTSLLGITINTEDFCETFPAVFPVINITFPNTGFENGSFVNWTVDANPSSSKENHQP